MWINIDIIPDNRGVIYLPEGIASQFGDYISASFGTRTLAAKVEVYEEEQDISENSFDKPMKIALSDSLKEKLEIPESLTYQMIFDKMHIEIGPVIGLLLGNRNHKYSPNHMEKYSDRFGIYKEVGGLIYAFSSNSIDWSERVAYGLYYNYSRAVWEYGRFPLPPVIYRRDFHSDPEAIKRLIEITEGRLYNSWRFSKYFLYQYIKRNSELTEYLPPTELLRSFEQAKRFIDRYKRVILKPVSLSRGRGICFILKEGNSYRVEDYRGKPAVSKLFRNDEELEEFFAQNKIFLNVYIAQKLLPLAKINGSPFDIRIVEQKDETDEWKCSGIECRVANNGSLLTNISRGGYALTIDEALRRAFPGSSSIEMLKHQLDDLCKELCVYLDRMGHHFAEFGIDIAIDENGKFWVIEVNVFPSFKGFKNMDYETYLNIRYTPIIYAAHLAGFYNNCRGEKYDE